MAFAWEKRAARYRDATSGRFVAERTVRAAAAQVVDASSSRMAVMTEQFRVGAVPIADWERSMRAEIKIAHLAQFEVAHGGRNAMTQADYGWIGSRIKDQYQYLNRFAAEIANGDQALNGRMVARAQMYGRAAHSTFEAAQARDAEALGISMEERNLMGGTEHHCGECPALERRGWVPLGSLPPVGSRECLANCLCRIQRRRVPRRARVLAGVA
jgi:hypothetical protein